MTVKKYKEIEESTRLKLIALGQKITKTQIIEIATKMNYGQKSIENYLTGYGQNLLTGLQILEAAK